MRALAVALLLSVPLTAGDKSSLEKAVELFKSPDAGKRTAGSQLAERELRKLLAPLLKAMEDDDPEMRRRARRSILSLVPKALEQETASEAAARRRAVVMRRFVAAAPVQIRVATNRAKVDAKVVRRLLSHFGVEAHLFRGVVVIGPASIPGGYRVTKVTDRSHAAHVGLRPGDFILRIHGKPARNPTEMLAAVGTKPDWTKVRLEVVRRGELVRLEAR